MGQLTADLSTGGTWPRRSLPIVIEGQPTPGVVPGAALPPGGSEAVDWITTATRRDRTVISAIPPGFDRYATIAIPETDDAKTVADVALVEVLQSHTTDQRWWLGYLDTGVAALVPAPKVSVYVGWPYALHQAESHEALSARTSADSTPWHSALPELIFPADRSWLVSTMWDDDWRCVGGPAALLDALVARVELAVRIVSPDEDATPPVHDRE